MIRTFRHRRLQRFAEAGDVRGLPRDQVARIRRILSAIDAATTIEQISLFPGWRLHPLTGDLAGFWSVSVTGNYRIVFRFENGDAFDLDYLDYH